MDNFPLFWMLKSKLSARSMLALIHLAFFVVLVVRPFCEFINQGNHSNVYVFLWTQLSHHNYLSHQSDLRWYIDGSNLRSSCLPLASSLHQIANSTTLIASALVLKFSAFLDWQCILDEDRKSFSKNHCLPQSSWIKNSMKMYNIPEIQK